MFTWNRKITLSALAIFITCLPTVSFAMNGTDRNGGEVVRDQNNNFRLRDLVDQAVCNYQNAWEFKNRLSEFPKVMNSIFAASNFGKIMYYYMYEDLSQISLCLTQGDLKPLADNLQDEITVYNSSNRKQIAVRIGNEIFIDQKLFEHLPVHDQAMLFFHELMHSLVPKETSARMMRIRSFVAYIEKNLTSGLKEDEFTTYVEKTGIQIPDYYTGKDIIKQKYSTEKSFVSELLDLKFPADTVLSQSLTDLDINIASRAIKAGGNILLKDLFDFPYSGNQKPEQRLAFAKNVYNLLEQHKAFNAQEINIGIVYLINRLGHLNLEKTVHFGNLGSEEQKYNALLSAFKFLLNQSNINVNLPITIVEARHSSYYMSHETYTDTNTVTLLEAAVVWQVPELVRLLLAKGADLNVHAATTSVTGMILNTNKMIKLVRDDRDLLAQYSWRGCSVYIDGYNSNADDMQKYYHACIRAVLNLDREIYLLFSSQANFDSNQKFALAEEEGNQEKPRLTGIATELLYMQTYGDIFGDDLLLAALSNPKYQFTSFEKERISTLLASYSFARSTAVFQALINRGIDPWAQGKDTLSLVSQMLKFLEDHYWDIVKNDEESRRLMTKWEDNILLFIGLDTADLGVLSPSNHNNLLHIAARFGMTKLAAALLKTKHFDINAAAKAIGTYNSGSVIFHAIMSENLDTIRLIASTPGIDWRAKDEYGNIPLYAAYCNSSIKKILVDAGADAPFFGTPPRCK